MKYSFMKCAHVNMMQLQGMINLPVKASSAMEVFSIANLDLSSPHMLINFLYLNVPFATKITHDCGYMCMSNVLTWLTGLL